MAISLLWTSHHRSVEGDAVCANASWKFAEVDGIPRAHGITPKDGITLEDGRERRRPAPAPVHATAITPAGWKRAAAGGVDVLTHSSHGQQRGFDSFVIETGRIS